MGGPLISDRERSTESTLAPREADVPRAPGWAYCARCVLPDTRPGLALDAEGVCTACRSHQRRPEVDWARRAAEFERLVQRVRSMGRDYDCVVPVSGGKDSTWQVVTCLEHGLRPLCVTWRAPRRTAIGQRNLDNLIALGVDHLDVSISPDVESRFARAAYVERGDPAIPMHMALFAIPLDVAARYGVPLVVWGENSAVEYGGADGAARGHRLDGAWLERYGVTGGTTWRDWIGAEGLSERDLRLYRGPEPERLLDAGCEAVFLGHYFPWDPARTAEVARHHGFESAPAARTGSNAAADIDDELISVHHWLKWHKFGFTRTFDTLSLEIRNGRMGREEAIAEIARRGPERPAEDIAAFCAFIGMTVDRFEEIADGYRDPRVWRHGGGVWRIDDFLIEEWGWA